MEETMQNVNKNVRKKKGGTTCCVPQCKNNNMKNPDISFYQFPRESSVKETWLILLGVKKQRLKSHQVCSLHFPGGKKTLNSLPTMPMSLCRQTKNSRNSPCPKLKNCTSVQPTEENLQMNELQSLYDSVTNEHTELQKQYDELSTKYNQCVLRIEHVIASDANFKFYTSFPNYAAFKYFLTICNLLVIFACTLVQRTQSIHQKCTTSVGDQGHCHQNKSYSWY